MANRPIREFIISVDRISEGTYRIKLEGCLDANTYTKFEATFDDLVSRGAKTMEVDMDKLDILSSAGVGSCIDITNSARKKGVVINYVNPKPNVREVIEILGLTKALFNA